MQRSNFRHFIELPVRWGDMDAFGHVNNVQFLRYLESARVAYCEEVLGGALGAQGEGIILVDIQCSFRQQLHYPVTLEVASRISRIGNSSLEILAAIFRKGQEEPVSASRGVMVWFDFEAQKGVQVPGWVRKAIYDYETLPPEGVI
ncbi:MAG: thioesterase family protein [Candidatus Competibacteraceae bacterium]|nr:thioesterase family protein [Candidatus Competibacteraceae bacterium]